MKQYPQFKRHKVWAFYDKLPESEKQDIEKYLIYRKGRGLNVNDKINDVKRYIVHLRYIYEKNLRELSLEDFRELLSLINSSSLSNNTKNHIKVDLIRFLKFLNKNWSNKFNDFEDVNLDSPIDEKRINSETIFSKEDIENLLKGEPSNFWKAFLLVQYEAGLRTIETRYLKWEEIKFEKDLTSLNIFSTKTKKQRTTFVKEATIYLQRLKQEQENSGRKGIYIFHSRIDINQPISKYSVSHWFRELTKRVLGRQGWNYLLRHTRANELYKLADENKISKDTAIKFMGHSKDMSGRYTHLDRKEVEEMLKNQVYNIKELTPKEENKIKKLEKELSEFREKQKITLELVEQLEPFLKMFDKRIIDGKEVLVLPKMQKEVKK